MINQLKSRLGDVGTVRALCLGAEAHARQDGQQVPGAEHFLLASLDLPDGSARRAFGRLGVDPSGLKAAIAKQYADALQLVGIEVSEAATAEPLPPPRGLYRAAPSGQHLLQALAARDGTARRLTSAHIVAAVAAVPHGVTARALRAMGVDLDTLREAARAEIAEAAQS